jgi:ornithine cyclodeaminase/alanine dehydrogenase-like protein (mu-crystallin family)
MSGMTLVLTDDQIAARLDAPRAVAALRAAILAAHAGDLAAPPRVSAHLDGGRLVLTAGQLGDRWFGFRSYDTFDLPDAEQLVVLHDGASGRVRAIAVGHELGSRRTGAIGGVAVDALSRTDATTLGVVGAGRQAWTQVWAAAAVRALDEVTVFSRTQASREAFASRVRAELGVPARAVDSAAAAVRGRDVVVLATNSPVPVVRGSDVAPGTHVNAVGFKQRGRSEFGPDLVARAAVVVTDSPAQAAAYEPPLAVDATGMRDLGAVLAKEVPGRSAADEITLFCSVGLAGTEVFLLDTLAG